MTMYKAIRIEGDYYDSPEITEEAEESGELPRVRKEDKRDE